MQHKMTQYNTLNVKLSNSQFNELKLGTKNDTKGALKLSSNIVGNSDDDNNFPCKLVLTNTLVWRLCKAFGIILQLI